jgi:methylmalonyl-CoA mutase C-terminal domain/subunit
MNKKIFRILIAKPGLDGHNRGARVVAKALRDAGYEVIYTGIRQAPEQIALTAIQEDVQIIGLSILSGAHLGLTQQVVRLLTDKGAGEIKVIVGGTISTKDVGKLKAVGVDKVFPVGSSLNDIISYIQDLEKT